LNAIVNWLKASAAGEGRRVGEVGHIGHEKMLRAGGGQDLDGGHDIGDAVLDHVGAAGRARDDAGQRAGAVQVEDIVREQPHHE
jgi:hypothetical protein